MEFDPSPSTLDKEEVVEEEVKEDVSLQPEAEVVEAEEEEDHSDDPIYKKIELELEDLYGETVKFSYVLEDGQYNVTLDSGESIVLIEEYIDSISL